jgi:hypothetical protein
MTPLEKSLLHEACGGREPRLLLRTCTRVDVGRWWRTSPLWLAIDGSDLVLFAVARRKYLERVPLADCHASQYIHSSGQLTVAPTESLRITHISLSPGEALRVLDAMGVPTH